MNRPWYVYILRCADNSLYTGIAANVAERMKVHENGKGAKYLRAKNRRPFELVFTAETVSRSEALKLESAIKKLPKREKEKLVKSHPAASEFGKEPETS